MLSIAVTALNEEKNLHATISNIIKAMNEIGDIQIEIIIINDGSSDGTADICKNLEKNYNFIKTIHHTTNTGIGISVRDALKIAKYPKFMIIPGDNDIGYDLIRNIFINRNKTDVILSYFINQEMRGRRRNTLSAIYRVIYMITFNVFVQYINGPAIYPTEKLRQVQLKSKRFSIVVEMTIKMLFSGCSYYEISGYMTRGLDGSHSFSFKNLLEVIANYLRLIWEIKIFKRNLFNQKAYRVY